MTFQKSWFELPNESPNVDKSDESHIRFPIELPKKFIGELTKEGDCVFDPFAGYGTTLFAAAELGRVGIGVEYEEKRAKMIEEELKGPSRVIHGDSRNLDSYDLPLFDLCFTSPPYMRSFDLENPLTNYHEEGTYEVYLDGMRKIFEQVKKRMKPNAYVLIEVENTFEPGKPMTPLVWDLARRLSDLFFLERELIYCRRLGDLTSDKVNHSTVLVFMNRFA